MWMLIGHGLTWVWAGEQPQDRVPVHATYMMEAAARHIPDTAAFAQAVDRVAQDLHIPPDWLMAVMYAESGLNPAAENRQGSGAAGLIQFLPAAAGELGTSVPELRRMDATAQLNYVHQYFRQVRQRYGPYTSLTDIYLGVLYPKARRQPATYVLYARPSRAYLQNAGLDEDRDGAVTVADITRRMNRLFPDLDQGRSL
jgi:hypothetical protein